MGGFKKYKEAVKEEIAFNAEQERLHNKHDQISEDTVIIEKRSTAKYVFRFIKAAVRSVFGIILIGLATIGILTLVYPETREAFLVVIQGIRNDLLDLIR